MAVIETQGFKLDNNCKRIVIDPMSRIEGHLRIEVSVLAQPRGGIRVRPSDSSSSY